MSQSEYMESSLPDDIALKLVSSLQVSDVCSLGSCSKFWRELCGSDCVWTSLCRDRWPLLILDKELSALTHQFDQQESSLEVKSSYSHFIRATLISCKGNLHTSHGLMQRSHLTSPG